ncbi:uncharacterized protein EI90DRAFT_1302418 [Cantharellus anzutake]|uniref:uncharacterized protein n=1 Tax=Cantharellus anzutake TaxID=1750568 RepID=UPI001908504D|nr:uncharacterized protein EI90DRAFT_1302418 [Cantharellus anzutake]KAF8342097.1 hypothetical protein EI90DRAFT_1302418 [Cantharellus anzutake]
MLNVVAIDSCPLRIINPQTRLILTKYPCCLTMYRLRILVELDQVEDSGTLSRVHVFCQTVPVECGHSLSPPIAVLSQSDSSSFSEPDELSSPPPTYDIHSKHSEEPSRLFRSPDSVFIYSEGEPGRPKYFSRREDQGQVVLHKPRGGIVSSTQIRHSVNNSKIFPSNPIAPPRILVPRTPSP